MARLDRDTKDFFQKMAGEEEHDEGSLRHLATARRIVRSAENPQRALGKAIVSGAVNTMLEKSGGTPVLGIFRLLNDHYKTSWWDWEPETIWKTLEEDHSFQATEEAKNLVMALQVVVTNNAPFEEWHAFEKVGHAFCQNPVFFGILQPLGVDEAAVTIALLKALRPKEEFDDEILGYVAARAKDSGIVFLPEGLFGKKCQDYLSRLGNNEPLARAVKARWESGSKERQPPEIAYQLAVLSEIKAHVDGIGEGK